MAIGGLLIYSIKDIVKVIKLSNNITFKHKKT